MRPSFGKSFKFPLVKTPRIDELAASGVAFQRAYCQAATCGVSRSSLLTGRRVDTTGVYDNGQCFYKTGGNWTSFPHYMKNNGYVTWGGGKVSVMVSVCGTAPGRAAAATMPAVVTPSRRRSSTRACARATRSARTRRRGASRTTRSPAPATAPSRARTP